MMIVKENVHGGPSSNHNFGKVTYPAVGILSGSLDSLNLVYQTIYYFKVIVNFKIKEVRYLLLA